MKKIVLILTIGVLCSTSVRAGLCSFDRVTNNSVVNIEGQLSVDVYSVGDDVAFKFYNNGPVASSISEIYFYDGVLLDMSSVDDTCEGVDYEDIGNKTSPKTLSGYDPDPALLEVFSAIEAESPEPAYGIKPGDWLTITYTLQLGKTYQDLVADLASGEVVVGIHVKSIGAGATSDSFITPEPATMALLALGGLLVRRKK